MNARQYYYYVILTNHDTIMKERMEQLRAKEEEIESMRASFFLLSFFFLTQEREKRPHGNYTYENPRIMSGLENERANLGFARLGVTHIPENTRSETKFNQTTRNLAMTVDTATEWNSAGQVSTSVKNYYTTIYPNAIALTIPYQKETNVYRGGYYLRLRSHKVFLMGMEERHHRLVR
jgi:hypothetical protein